MDMAKALEWYERAANNGHVSAQYMLAVLYQQGEGVEKVDEKKAAKWYRAAAVQGMPEAQVLLADCYLRGRGVAEDYVMAHVWFSCAASQGIEIAGRYLRLTESCMTSSQVASAQAKARSGLVA